MPRAPTGEKKWLHEPKWWGSLPRTRTHRSARSHRTTQGEQGECCLKNEPPPLTSLSLSPSLCLPHPHPLSSLPLSLLLPLYSEKMPRDIERERERERDIAAGYVMTGVIGSTQKSPPCSVMMGLYLKEDKHCLQPPGTVGPLHCFKYLLLYIPYINTFYRNYTLCTLSFCLSQSHISSVCVCVCVCVCSLLTK